VADPDCRGGGLAACESCKTCSANSCDGAIDPTDPTKCAPPPAEWVCDADLFGDGYSCDCGCGVQDPDCYLAEVDYCSNCPIEGCSGGNCARIDRHDNKTCNFNVPSAWTCGQKYYGDGVCDCGCGVRDSDCTTGTRSECYSCNLQGSCSTLTCKSAASNINATDNSVCTSSSHAF
jgi:hypothetical protein